MAKRQVESQRSATDFALEHPPYPLAARERVGRQRAWPGVMNSTAAFASATSKMGRIGPNISSCITGASGLTPNSTVGAM